MTASFNMQPVPKRMRPSWWGIPQVFGQFAGDTPIVEVRMMENPNSADQRRRGIYKLMQRDFAQEEPYTRRYRQIAQSDPDPTVRAAAIRASNASRDKAAVPVFIAALNDKSDMVRLQAAKALSNIPDRSAADPLMRVLGNQAEQRDVRIAASEALRNYRNLDVARVLAGTVGGRDFSIAWQSRWSLIIMTGRDLGYDEHKWREFLAGPDKPLG
jgi:HEAT repeats